MSVQDQRRADTQSSTTETAKEQASGVADRTKDAAGDVARTSTEQAREVAGEVRRQGRDLVGEARTQVRAQASDQRQNAARSLHDLGGELEQMADRSESSGLGAELARQAAGRAHDLAGFLDNNDIDDLLNQVRSFARRRPMAFLVGAALAGVAAGRLTRGVVASRTEESGERTGYRYSVSSVPPLQERYSAAPSELGTAGVTSTAPGGVEPGVGMGPGTTVGEPATGPGTGPRSDLGEPLLDEPRRDVP
ncbi:MAG: hypothetical protein ICV70_04975 [Jiangellaceae bacterium]|nr:hypothetical protein [Jiangellaceae bacterium]